MRPLAPCRRSPCPHPPPQDRVVTGAARHRRRHGEAPRRGRAPGGVPRPRRGPLRRHRGGITDAGGQAIGVGVDVADADQVAAAVAQVAEALGAPTILVNNAGITRDNLIFKMTEQDWDAVIGVHLRGSSS